MRLNSRRSIVMCRQPITFNPRQVPAELRDYIRQWDTLTAENVRETRRLLEAVLRDRIVFRPFVDVES